ncbi:hypothetical protein H5410_021408 [Solanum commersonii]|uniref:Uncharacterized protein n=1 Tax=Solanum commersonii TaxID=4109 RepID=A0A9J5ZDX7_SOLCO|nr:hypothetical protein H5410_021408 [Solanum commersonii]
MIFNCQGKLSSKAYIMILQTLPPRLSSSGKMWRICGLGRKFNPHTMQSEARLGTIFIFLISKSSALLELIESFPTTKSPESLRARLKRTMSMLLEEELSAELRDDDVANLIRLLFASTRKAVLEKIVPASDNKKKYHTKAQKVRFFSSCC